MAVVRRRQPPKNEGEVMWNIPHPTFTHGLRVHPLAEMHRRTVWSPELLSDTSQQGLPAAISKGCAQRALLCLWSGLNFRHKHATRCSKQLLLAGKNGHVSATGARLALCLASTLAGQRRICQHHDLTVSNRNGEEV